MQLKEIIEFNRNSLSGIDSFVEESDYYNSPDIYGLPERCRPLIDLPINNQVTYVDLLMFLRHQLSQEIKNVKYVEIGVSVLKTFYQVSKFLKDSHLYAFDINKINPTIEKYFSPTSRYKSLSQYKFESNNISYFRGDVFSSENLKEFREHIGTKVNIVFSDAYHSRQGLVSEYEHFIKYILDDEFILYYDDLENLEMRNVFQNIYRLLKSQKKTISGGLVGVNGWVGQHAHAHLNGIITSLDIGKILKENNINIPFSYL